MPLSTDEKSQRGSHTELDQFLGEQLKSKGKGDETKTTIEGIELVEKQVKSTEEEGLLGENETASSGKEEEKAEEEKGEEEKAEEKAEPEIAEEVLFAEEDLFSIVKFEVTGGSTTYLLLQLCVSLVCLHKCCQSLFVSSFLSPFSHCLRLQSVIVNLVAHHQHLRDLLH